MAQLRDKQTSHLIAEGTPLEMATLASKVGFDEVVFDDVGEHFDPQTVLDAHAAVVDNIPSDAPDEYKQQVAGADKLERGAIKAANDAIAAARAQITEE